MCNYKVIRFTQWISFPFSVMSWNNNYNHFLRLKEPSFFYLKKAFSHVLVSIPEKFPAAVHKKTKHLPVSKRDLFCLEISFDFFLEGLCSLCVSCTRLWLLNMKSCFNPQQPAVSFLLRNHMLMFFISFPLASSFSPLSARSPLNRPNGIFNCQHRIGKTICFMMATRIAFKFSSVFIAWACVDFH